VRLPEEDREAYADLIRLSWRVIPVDLDGQPVLIILDSADPVDQAAWVEQAVPIVDHIGTPATLPARPGP
jgi:hypothetical protein